MTDIFIYHQRKEDIGKRIRELRKKAEMTQSDLAARLELIVPHDGDKGMHQSSISDWENGKQLPPINKIVALASIFRCDVSYLLCDYDTKNKDYSAIGEVVGLSERAVEKLHDLRCENQITWFSDTLNSLIEHENFVLLLHYALGYISAGDAVSETIEPEHQFSISYKDAYRMKISDSFEKILSSIAPEFEKKGDYRWLYQLYRSMKGKPNKHGVIRSLDEIRRDMEKNNLK